jgi:hypothetical protein
MLTLPPRAVDGANKAVPNARWYFFAAGTSKALPAYADPGLAEEHPNPLICDNAGTCPPVYFDPLKSYRAVLRSADGRTVLADIDPANANLGASPFGSAPGYREDAPGAVSRPIADKLRDEAVDVGDFGVLDRTGATDVTDLFARAYAAAAASGRPLRLPAGTFAVSGLVWDANVEVFGQGAGQTIFTPTGDDQTVVTIVGDRADGDRTRKRVIRDFGIRLGGKVRCLGLSTAHLVRTTLARIAIVGTEWFHDDAGYERWAETDNTGWVSLADQYCNFQEIHIEFVRLGFVLRPEEEAGAGVNNIFDGLHVSYVQVGAMMFDDVGFGVGVNTFRNLKLQVCSHCALYSSNIIMTSFSGIPIEYSGFERASISLLGRTVKGSAMHIERSQLRFEDCLIPPYQLGTTPTKPYPVVIEGGSHITFVNSSANGLIDVDDGSNCEFEGTYGHGAQFTGSRLDLQRRGASAMIAAVTPLDYAIDAALPNDAPLPATPITMDSGDVSRLVNGDEALGIATQVKFAASASSAMAATLDRNAVYVQAVPSAYEAGDTAVISLPVMAESDTVLICHPPGLGAWRIPLKARQWGRIFISNRVEQTIGGGMIVGPAGGDAPVVNFGPLMSIKNASAEEFRRLSRGHFINPKDAYGSVLRSASTPTAGTWHAGAMVYNADLQAAVIGWRCIAAGTPGAWQPIMQIVHRSATVAPGADYALPNDDSDMQVRTSDTTAIIQGRVTRGVPGPIAFGTTVAIVPPGFRPLTYARPIMVCVHDGGGGEWDAVPAQIDPYTGALMLLRSSMISASSVYVNAAFTAAAPI